MLKGLGEKNRVTLAPVGKKEPVQKTGHFCLSKTPTGALSFKHPFYMRGKKSINWKGGIYKDSYGYVLIYAPEHPFCDKDRYVKEHRLVVEKYLGRYLASKEVVHHINGIKDDNRIENLAVFKNNGFHLAFEQGKKINRKGIIFINSNQALGRGFLFGGSKMRKLFIIMLLTAFLLPNLSVAEITILFSTKGKYVEARSSEPVNPEFVSQLDTLYKMDCKALGVDEKNIGLVIVFYKTDKEIDALYGQTLPHKAYFVAKDNTIYASIESMTDGMMAHEIAHALVFNRLGNKANIIMQEILAKYTEHWIIKNTGKSQ